MNDDQIPETEPSVEELHEAQEVFQTIKAFFPPRVSREHLEPRGRLLDKPAYHALWYFMRCAHHAEYEVPRQLTLEGDLDVFSDLLQIVRSVAMNYGITPADMFESEVWRRVQAEAKACRLPITPKIKGFVESGGQTYARFDRDPDIHEKESLDDADS